MSLILALLGSISCKAVDCLLLTFQVGKLYICRQGCMQKQQKGRNRRATVQSFVNKKTLMAERGQGMHSCHAMQLSCHASQIVGSGKLKMDVSKLMLTAETFIIMRKAVDYFISQN